MMQISNKLILASLCLNALSLSAEPIKIPQIKYNLEDWKEFRDHPGTPPFLSEFGYRSLADHHIDPLESHFDPTCVERGDIIYVGVWKLKWFIQNIHDRIKHPYILITCDVGGYLPTKSHLKLAYDPKVAAWFAKNMIFSNHAKLFQLPMGQSYHLWVHEFYEQLPFFCQMVETKPHIKEHLLYLNHYERPHGRRIEVADYFWDKPYCYSRNRTGLSEIRREEYWEELAASKFCLSPLGLEIGCTRTWECFSLGTIPIVEHSFLDPLYEGLPALLIHDWKEINQDFLEQKYDKIMQDTSLSDETTYLAYWKKLIFEKKQSVQKGENTFSLIEANEFQTRDLTDLVELLEMCPLKKIYYSGHLTGTRPYQLQQAIQGNGEVVFFDDYCISKEQLIKFTGALSYALKGIKYGGSPGSLLRVPSIQSHLFLDLTHYRHTFQASHETFRDFKHDLEESIVKLYSKMKPGCMLLGNMSQDQYIVDICMYLSVRHDIQVTRQGNFWYVIKPAAI